MTNGTFYSYEVSAVGLGGQSDYINAPIVMAVPNVVYVSAQPLALPSGTGSVTVYWQTNVLADGTVAYGKFTNFAKDKSVSDHHLTFQHTLTITGLKTGKTYYFRVADFDGKVTAVSQTYTFTAP